MTEFDRASNQPTAAPPVEADRAPESLRSDVWHQFRRHKGALAGVAILTAILLVVFAGPFIWTVSPQLVDFRHANKAMSLLHPLGTDNLGHDTLAQIMAGGRVSLSVGIVASDFDLVRHHDRLARRLFSRS